MSNAIQFYQNKILFGDSVGNNTDKIAFHQDCCCGCEDGDDCHGLNVLTDDIDVDYAGEQFGNDGCEDCSSTEPPYTLVHTTGPDPASWTYHEVGGICDDFVINFYVICNDQKTCQAQCDIYFGTTHFPGYDYSIFTYKSSVYGAQSKTSWTLLFDSYSESGDGGVCDPNSYPASVTAAKA